MEKQGEEKDNPMSACDGCIPTAALVPGTNCLTGDRDRQIINVAGQICPCPIAFSYVPIQTPFLLNPTCLFTYCRETMSLMAR